jgi:phospholipid-binding lipoprotein MlaA
MLSAVIPAAPALAKVAAAPAAPNPDPWESANRGLYKLNQGLDRAVVRPGAVFYHHALSHSIREGVHNVLYNLGEPVTFVNDVLQVRPGKAGQSAVRFVVNSTVGIGGVFDVTGGQGLQREPSGFAQTLTRYGAPQGPYIFIPIFGPSSVRDLSGRVADAVTDPFTWINYGARPYVQAARSVLGGIDQRVALDPVLKDVNLTATDPYATLRSAFLQSSSITGDSVKDAKALPDFNAEPPPASSNPPHQ